MRKSTWLSVHWTFFPLLTYFCSNHVAAFTSRIDYRRTESPFCDYGSHVVPRNSRVNPVWPVSSSSKKSSKTSLFLWSKDEEITGSDKIKACVPYILPLLDGELFGRYIYERVPPLGFLDSLFIGPLYEFYSQIPLLGLILFLVLTLGTRGNTEMNRAVRFNAQQAALIDVILVFPELIGSAFEGEDIPRYLVEPCMNFVWYTYMAMVLYSVYANLRGKKPDQIPWISGYAEVMVGPF